MVTRELREIIKKKSEENDYLNKIDRIDKLMLKFWISGYIK